MHYFKVSLSYYIFSFDLSLICTVKRNHEYSNWKNIRWNLNIAKTDENEIYLKIGNQNKLHANYRSVYM